MKGHPDGDTAELGEEATSGAEEAAGSTERSGNGRAVYLGASGVLLLGILVEGNRLVGRRVLVLNDG